LLRRRGRPGALPPRVEEDEAPGRPPCCAGGARPMSLSLTIIPRRFFATALVAALFGAAAGGPALSQTPKDEAKEHETAKEKDQDKAKAKATLDQPPPTFANVPYGDHPRQVLDFYQAQSSSPTPLVVYIHGGGWMNGDKARISTVDLKKLLAGGISVAAIN